ncbi:MGMT family protein [Thalassolituus sp. LLYu03]|uniref:MGMT family protein n=1 Tax=Thalassolituus sp. LLYu03 TaxID=3421656 RepID=UPI003D27A95C
MNSDPKERLYTALAGIPAGRVITYGQLAAQAGFPRRARWVGQVLNALPEDTQLPWHRVINAQGKISQPTPHNLRQRDRLVAEGIEVSASFRVDLNRFGWN